MMKATCWLQALLLLICHQTTSADNSNSNSNYIPKNVYGGTLQSCSSDGSARAGYTRSGYCVNEKDDVGSHHICINLAAIASSGQNFCQVTGQSDWCSSSMPCHENKYQSCQVENWCVCQWAFASYIQKAGGCSAIQHIQCDAINIHALYAYEKSSEDKHKEALQCIYDRCFSSSN